MTSDRLLWEAHLPAYIRFLHYRSKGGKDPDLLGSFWQHCFGDLPSSLNRDTNSDVTREPLQDWFYTQQGGMIQLDLDRQSLSHVSEKWEDQKSFSTLRCLCKKFPKLFGTWLFCYNGWDAGRRSVNCRALGYVFLNVSIFHDVPQKHPAHYCLGDFENCMTAATVTRRLAVSIADWFSFNLGPMVSPGVMVYYLRSRVQLTLE